MNKENNLEMAAGEKENVFRNLRAEIEPMVSEKQYGLARKKIGDELRAFCDVWHPSDSAKLAELREEFEDCLPADIRSLLSRILALRMCGPGRQRSMRSESG